jgi:hypothetical protein
MPETDIKPLNWTPDPDIGYTVTRREDGGMHYVFTDMNSHTIRHWREFSLEHLLDSDRLTRNLYDLRQVNEIPKEAIQAALEVGDDPSARNIRLAVVVANDAVRRAIEDISLLIEPGGAEIEIFTTVDEAETWLDRPLTLLR